MSNLGIGDMSRAFSSRLQNLDIRDRLFRLSDELATGKPADLGAHLDGDRTRLSDVDRQISLAQGFAGTTRALGQTLSTMQSALGRMDDVRSGLGARLLTTTPASTDAQQTSASDAARGAFADLVSSLNTRFGGAALFAGTTTDGTALADADAMMTSLRASVLGAVTASDVETAVDLWFNDPAGGFATMGYTGDTGADLTRRIDTDTDVTIAPRADHPTVKDLLRATAIAALAADPALGLPRSTTTTLLSHATVDLLSAAEPLTALRADLGAGEERVATALASHVAAESALGIMRNDLALVDPYATATALQQVQTQLETHYTLTARLANLSLVGYLR